MTTTLHVGPLTPAAPAIGDTQTVRCVTYYTEHTGPVVSVVPAAQYADGQISAWRVTIRDEQLGREVIAW